MYFSRFQTVASCLQIDGDSCGMCTTVNRGSYRKKKRRDISVKGFVKSVDAGGTSVRLRAFKFAKLALENGS